MFRKEPAFIFMQLLFRSVDWVSSYDRQNTKNLEFMILIYLLISDGYTNALEIYLSRGNFLY